MISSTDKKCGAFPRTCSAFANFVKGIQDPRSAMILLLLLAVMGWAGIYDTALKYLPSDGYTKHEMQFFSIFDKLIHTTEKELTTHQKQFLKIQKTLETNLAEFRQKIDQLDTQKDAKPADLSDFKQAIEVPVENNITQLKSLNQQIETILASMQALNNIIPEKGEIFNIEKTTIRNDIVSLKIQLEDYARELEDYRAFAEKHNISIHSLGLHQAIALLNHKVAELPSTDTAGKLETTRNRLLITFGTLKAINGVVSIIQSVETGGSVMVANASIRFGEWLDPLNDLVEQASEFVLYAVISVSIQEILLTLGNALGLSVILPLGLIVFACSYFPQCEVLRKRLRKAANTIILLAFFAKLFIPTSVWVSDYVMDRFLLEKYNPAISKIQENHKKIEQFKDTSFLKNITSDTKEWLEPIENITFKNIFMLVTIFLFETILLPLATGVVMLRSFQYFVFYRKS